jgi:hypothetical protein
MPNAIKYNTSTESLALKKGNFWFGTGDVGKGTTAATGFYDGITPAAGGYTIYLNKASGGPQIHTAANDTQLITLTNIIAGTSYTTANECFNYFNGQTDKVIFNRDYQPIITNGLIMNLDAGFVASFPRNGSTWYDLSGNGNDGTIYNGEWITTSGGGYLRNTNNESNFFYVYVGNTTPISNTFSVTSGGWTIEEIIWTNSTIYPEADAGSVISDAAYGTNNTGFDWNHGIGIGAFQFGQSNNGAAGTYDDTVYISSIPSQYAQFNTWRIRTMVWNRGTNTNSLYINGVYIGGGSTPNTANDSLYDGGGCYFGTLYGWKFYGRRGAIKIYNRVLSASEILQNFDAQKTLYGL